MKLKRTGKRLFGARKFRNEFKSGFLALGDFDTNRKMAFELVSNLKWTQKRLFEAGKNKSGLKNAC